MGKLKKLEKLKKLKPYALWRKIKLSMLLSLNFSNEQRE